MVRLSRSGEHALPLPPARMLTRAQAAAYLGLGATAPIPVAPKRLRPGKQGLRYDVRQLDAYLDALEEGENRESDEEVLAGLFHGKGARPRR
ncbi:hypothetical protein Mnod_1967 [Methylobacterium nodulans ORS 2060]|uniref:Uncharacterized protein n=1 Tax=Methylobacterium nodulans (strain LMG 21967 / CNCM I-2342 / ORS 2060) TaxID=460265 RepID=B8IT69_METNO|nr:hypothetical protein Mnod_1967 [Methylobacterium nodulans ORS 2060]